MSIELDGARLFASFGIDVVPLTKRGLLVGQTNGASATHSMKKIELWAKLYPPETPWAAMCGHRFNLIGLQFLNLTALEMLQNEIGPLPQTWRIWRGKRFTLLFVYPPNRVGLDRIGPDLLAGVWRDHTTLNVLRKVYLPGSVNPITRVRYTLDPDLRPPQIPSLPMLPNVWFDALPKLKGSGGPRGFVLDGPALPDSANLMPQWGKYTDSKEGW